jgi:hypothetical protein
MRAADDKNYLQPGLSSSHLFFQLRQSLFVFQIFAALYYLHEACSRNNIPLQPCELLSDRPGKAERGEPLRAAAVVLSALYVPNPVWPFTSRPCNVRKITRRKTTRPMYSCVNYHKALAIKLRFSFML